MIDTLRLRMHQHAASAGEAVVRQRAAEGSQMSDCIHCQIHDLLESHLQNQ